MAGKVAAMGHLLYIGKLHLFYFAWQAKWQLWNIYFTLRSCIFCFTLHGRQSGSYGIFNFVTIYFDTSVNLLEAVVTVLGVFLPILESFVWTYMDGNLLTWHKEDLDLYMNICIMKVGV